MEQYILKTDGVLPTLNEDNEWVDATVCVFFREQFWLDNIVSWIFFERTGESLADGVIVPLSRDDVRKIIVLSKECVRVKSESFTMDTFNLGLFGSAWEFDFCLECMRHFNRCMSGRLKSCGACFFYVRF